MTDQNPENPPPIQQPAPPANDNRRRLRELLSIPERDRSDEQWDEIIELEIQLAPGNRISASEHGGGPGGGSGGGGALSVPALLLLGALRLRKKKSQESA